MKYLHFAILVLTLSFALNSFGQVSQSVTSDISYESSNDGLSTDEEVSLDDEARTTFEFSFDVLSQYVDVNGFVNSPDEVVQYDLTATIPTPDFDIYIDLWGSNGLRSSFDSGFDDEIDFYVGLTKEFEDGVNFDVSLAYFAIYPLRTFEDEDAVQLAFEISKDFEVGENHVFTPFIRTETLFSLEWQSIKGETYIYGGLGHEWAIAEDWTLATKSYILYDPGIYELDSGFIGTWQPELHWAICENLTLKLKGAVFVPLTTDDEREVEGVIDSGLTWEF